MNEESRYCADCFHRVSLIRKEDKEDTYYCETCKEYYSPRAVITLEQAIERTKPNPGRNGHGTR